MINNNKNPIRPPSLVILFVTIFISSILRICPSVVQGFSIRPFVSTPQSLTKSFSRRSTTNSINNSYFSVQFIPNRTFANTIAVKELKATSSSDLDHIFKQTADDLNKLTVVQIKEILRQRDLKVSGRKAELIDRLLQHQQKQELQEQQLGNYFCEIISTATNTTSMPRRSPRKRKSSNETDDVVKTAVVTEDTSSIENKKDSKIENENDNQSTVKSTAKTAKSPRVKKTKVEPQRITDRDELDKLWNAEVALQKGSYSK
jgi:hypothetical protein